MDNPRDIVARERIDEPLAEPLVDRAPSAAPVSKVAAAAQANPAGPSPAAPPRTTRRAWLRPALFALLPVALVAGGYVYVTGGAVMSTENAYVQADMVAVSTDISGIVKEIRVADNQKVSRGDVLFTLDDQQYRFALDKAEAQIGIVRNDLAALKASYRNMQAQIEQAQTDIEFYDTSFKRQQQLASRNFASQATFDQAEHDLTTAKQRQGLLKEQLAGIAANLNGDPDAPIENHPRFKDAVASRDEAARQLSHTVVRAPIDGIATNVSSLQPGQYLASAASAFSVVSDDHVWVMANPKETELTYVNPGQSVTVSVDTYPDVAWTGVVDSISPASSASFSLLPAENSSGNWVKVVQRIPMRVSLQLPSGKPRLRAGMSVIVDVDTGHPRGLPTFLTRLMGRSTDGQS